MEKEGTKSGLWLTTCWRSVGIRQSSTASHAVSILILNVFVLICFSINFRFSDRTIFEFLFGVGVFRHYFGWIFDAAILIFCGFNLCDELFLIGLRFWHNLTSTPIALTPPQRKLLGIDEDDIRFQSTPTTAPKSPKDVESVSPFSLPDLSWLFHLTPKKRRSPGSPSSGAVHSPRSYNFCSSPDNNYYQSPNFASSSPFRVRFSPIDNSNCSYLASNVDDIGFNEALDKVRYRGYQTSPIIDDIEPRSPPPPKSILKKINQETIDRSRIDFSSSFGQSPIDYRKNRSGVRDESDSMASSKSIDFSILASYRYQPSQNSINDSVYGSGGVVGKTSIVGQSPSIGRISGADSSSSSSIDSIWNRYGIANFEILEEQILRLRLWISSTILKPLIKEIDFLNKKSIANASAHNRSSPDFLIGECSLLQLQSIVASKFDQYPTLSALLPYLELSTNQGYLIERLRELGSKDACLQDFRWMAGSRYKNKDWDDRLINDSDLIMHLFSTYLNSKLPLHPLCPEGKSFTSHYFIQHLAKPPTTSDKKIGRLIIYQNCTTPPNYQILIDDEIVELGKGKNNLFATLLLFFHHLKSKFDSRLDTMNLGKAGLNVGWVLE